MNEITYQRKNDEIECIHYKNWNKVYRAHTHANHITIGFIEEGCVCIVQEGESEIYTAGKQFQILPHVTHEIKPVDNKTYSMVVMCITAKVEADDQYLEKLKNDILAKPENIYLIEEMAQQANISPFYMIRQFKKAFGLTPHQFQIQCKVRKAQRLLEEGKSITEVTYDAGFCDQSHLDRSFQKIVGLTPSQYKKSLRPED